MNQNLRAHQLQFDEISGGYRISKQIRLQNERSPALQISYFIVLKAAYLTLLKRIKIRLAPSADQE